MVTKRTFRGKKPTEHWVKRLENKKIRYNAYFRAARQYGLTPAEANTASLEIMANFPQEVKSGSILLKTQFEKWAQLQNIRRDARQRHVFAGKLIKRRKVEKAVRQTAKQK